MENMNWNLFYSVLKGHDKNRRFDIKSLLHITMSAETEQEFRQAVWEYCEMKKNNHQLESAFNLPPIYDLFMGKATYVHMMAIDIGLLKTLTYLYLFQKYDIIGYRDEN